MIADELEFRCSVRTLAKMYTTRDNAADETAWHESTRDEIVYGID